MKTDHHPARHFEAAIIVRLGTNLVTLPSGTLAEATPIDYTPSQLAYCDITRRLKSPNA